MLIGACARMSAEVTDVIGAAELLLGRTIRVPVTTTTWLLSVDVLPSLLSAGVLSPDVDGACAETGKANKAARQEPARSVFIRAMIFPFSFAADSPSFSNWAVGQPFMFNMPMVRRCRSSVPRVGDRNVRWHAGHTVRLTS